VFLNKQISLAFVITYAGWAIAIGTWIVSWIVDSDHLGQGAVLVAVVAAVVTSRLTAAQQARELHNALTIVRGADSVTPLSRR
jgi:hypothetical protein